MSATHTHHLQRQCSAPAGRTNRPSPCALPVLTAFDASNSLPPSAVNTSAQYDYLRTNLGNIDEVQVFHPADYLEHAQDDTPSASVTPPPAVERGEFDYQTNSNLTYHEAFDQSIAQPMAPISASSLISGSSALSEPMTRSDTNDVLCKGVDMFRMNSMPKSESELTKTDDANQALPFSFSPNMVPTQYHEISYSGSPPFSYSSEMQPSLSHESDSSSHLSSIHSSPRLEESITSGRLLAPKLESSLSPAENPRFKLVDVKGEDGTVTRKAEIARETRKEPDRKNRKLCPFCHDNPTGFHGLHELQRHIDRHHSSRRKVWICKEKFADGTFLANCKACRNKVSSLMVIDPPTDTVQKTYGANYNAAAHLRRAHFNPPKNKRGGRGKKSENRGGMGGGNKPSMDELKHWMYEEWEDDINKSGHVACLPTDSQPDDSYQRGYYDAMPEYALPYTHDAMMMPAMHHQPVAYAIPTTMAGRQPVPPTYRPQWAPAVY